MRHGGLALLALLLGACAGLDGRPVATWPTPAAGNRDVLNCRQAFRTIDQAVDDAGVGDAEAARIDGFPYLRTNRFLASFRHQSLTDAALKAWVDRLAALDRQGRQVELANLPSEDRAALGTALRVAGNGGKAVEDVMRGCRRVLRDHDVARPEGIALLRRAARVPDHYSNWARLAGLYPLTSIGVAAGFGLWKSNTLDRFRESDDAPQPQGSYVRYLPAVSSGRARSLTTAEVAAIVAGSRRNPLAIPEPDGAALRRLIGHFAPIWRVERAGPADDVGKPLWRSGRDGPAVGVDTGRAVGYARLSYTRFGSEILPQISYTVWFSERPKTSALDILGGRLDAVIWRVTIGSDGRPLLYDTIHACGCYHLFFPVPPLKKLVTPEDKDLREEALVPAPGPMPGPGERTVVRLSAGSHYVTGVSRADPAVLAGTARSYLVIPPGDVPDLDLRSAALPEADGGRRSLFGPDGIIEGSERLERFLLWPMGIASPGAMRQWGTHATAFVGLRHFDDPEFIDRTFRL